MTAFPGAIASLVRVTRYSDASAGAATEPSTVVDQHADEIEAIEAELGVNPSGAYPTVTARFADLGSQFVGIAALDQASGVAVLDSGRKIALARLPQGAGGVLVLDGAGLVPTAALPPLAINEVFTVTSQAAMLALTAQRGDMAIRTDSGLTYVLSTDSPSTLADWKQVLAAGQVTSVAGRTGVVTLSASDISGLGGAATLNTGTAAGTVAAGDDSRIVGSLQKSTATTKGDLYVATGAGAVTRLGAGSDGQVLTADSTQPTGLKYAPVPSGNKDWFTAYGGSWEAGQAGAGVPLLSPPLRIPPNGTINMPTATATYIRTTAQASGAWQGLAFFCTAKPTTVSWYAALYTTDGVRRAVTANLANADINTTDITYALFGSAYTVTAGTDYYLALWFSFASGTMTLAGLTFPASFIGGYMASSPLAANNSTNAGSGLPASGAAFTGSLPGAAIPWVAAI